MKKHLFTAVIVLLGIVSLQSCKKPRHETKYITLDETVQSGNTFALDLTSYGDADDIPSISTQATTYVVSQINKDAVTARDIYNFSSSVKAQDKQTVVITLTENHAGSGGGRCDGAVAVITINFTIF